MARYKPGHVPDLAPATAARPVDLAVSRGYEECQVDATSSSYDIALRERAFATCKL